jgi:hypothetical protein
LRQGKASDYLIPYTDWIPGYITGESGVVWQQKQKTLIFITPVLTFVRTRLPLQRVLMSLSAEIKRSGREADCSSQSSLLDAELIVCGDYLSFLSNSKEPFGPISKKKLETHL